MSALPACSAARESRAIRPIDLVDRSGLASAAPASASENGERAVAVVPEKPTESDAAGTIDAAAHPEPELPGSIVLDGSGIGASGGAAGAAAGADADPSQTGAATATAGAAGTAGGADATRRPRTEWIVESLVGQVNGRPIFAEQFLDPIEDRLLRISEEEERAEARRAIIVLVGQRFDEFVNSELVIAEAESLLSPEQKQGLLAWLRDFQEGEIAKRGGTRTSAESSLQEDFGLTIEEYMSTSRNQALASDLLRRRVRPRAIVSWRDIEREFADRSGDFAPGATLRVGRIWLSNRDEASQIELATARFAEGRTFAEVAAELELVEGGAWRDFSIGDEGMEGIDELADPIKEALLDLMPGEVSRPVVLGGRTWWLTILEIDRPPARSIYEREVQLMLRQELEDRREGQERERYIKSLRLRWIAENIDNMRTGLVEIALRRYWR